MRAHALLVVLVLSAAAIAAHAESITHYLGRVIGDFGAGVGEEPTQPLVESQPRWVIVATRSETKRSSLAHQVLSQTYS